MVLPLRDRRASQLVLTGAAALVTVTCAAGCGSSTVTAGGDLITLDQARQVAKTYVHATYEAEIAEESGSLQRIDKGAAAMRSDPAPTADATPHDDVIWMAHQTQYPVSFLCYDRARQPGQMTMAAGQLYRFSKASASAPWTVTHQDALLPSAAIPAVALDAGGFAQQVQPGDYGKFLASPAKLAQDWAAYLTAGNAADAHEFASGPLTTTGIESLKKNRDAVAAQHGTMTTSFAPTADPVDAYLLKDGSALVLVGVEETQHIVAQSGVITITQDGKGIVGPAPGTYHDYTTSTLFLAAFTVPVKGSSLKVTPVGAYFGTVATTATKATKA